MQPREAGSEGIYGRQPVPGRPARQEWRAEVAFPGRAGTIGSLVVLALLRLFRFARLPLIMFSIAGLVSSFPPLYSKALGVQGWLSC